MGWNIGHRPDTDDMRRSYTSMHNLGQHLAHVLSAGEWRTIKPLFKRRTEEYFTVSPADAARMATVIRAAAGHRKMPVDWAQDARELADSAQNAADIRRPWNWR